MSDYKVGVVWDTRVHGYLATAGSYESTGPTPIAALMALVATILHAKDDEQYNREMMEAVHSE